MPKATARPARKPYHAAALSDDDIDLRRWCIEQATRWPVEYGSAGYAGTSMPKPSVEVDVIGRATRILNWVTGAK